MVLYTSLGVTKTTKAMCNFWLSWQ